MMLTTVLLYVFLLFVNSIYGRTFHLRQTDSLTVMREQCAANPFAEECTRVKQKMEDLLRRCNEMSTPVPACNDVKDKFCTIWPSELYCFMSGGGGIHVNPGPSWNTDSDWNQVPADSSELRSRATYCLTHPSEQKCRNFMNALNARYTECGPRPSTDISCHNFKTTFCSSFPTFSKCLNSAGGWTRRSTRLEHLLRM